MTAGEDLSWIPPTDRAGHPLGPGRLSLSWVSCSCQPGGGHHVARCRVNGCPAGAEHPPECPGPPSQR